MVHMVAMMTVNMMMGTVTVMLELATEHMEAVGDVVRLVVWACEGWAMAEWPVVVVVAEVVVVV